MGWFRRTPSGGRGPTFEERLAQIGPGVPGRCPACDGLGYIDSIDIGHRYQIQHCKDCQHRWEYLFDADGLVVGLTELDETGQPVARSRVRQLRPTPAPVLVEVASERVASTGADEEVDVVVDLRDEVLDLVDGPGPALDGPELLSPAEWLRQSTGR